MDLIIDLTLKSEETLCLPHCNCQKKKMLAALFILGIRGSS